MKLEHSIQLTMKGYGHYKVTTTHYGKEISCITTDVRAVDDYRSDEFEKDGRELRKLRGYKALREECIRSNKR